MQFRELNLLNVARGSGSAGVHLGWLAGCSTVLSPALLSLWVRPSQDPAEEWLWSARLYPRVTLSSETFAGVEVGVGRLEIT